MRDAQALEHLAIVRGADGAEEDVGDNLRRLAVGLDLLGCGRREGGNGGSVNCEKGPQVVGSRGGRARAGRGEGGYARASRATAEGGIGSNRPRGNSIETRDERVARAPCDARRARKASAPHVEAAGCLGVSGRKKRRRCEARALTGQQALDEVEDLPDPLALSGDLVVIAHLPRAALPEQPERVGKRLREVGWRIRLAAARREPNLRRSHPRKGRTAGRVGAVVPAAAASRRSNFRSRESETLLDRVRDPALDPRASRGRGVFPHASRSFQLSVRRSFTTEAVTSRPRLADRDLLERDLRDANFASTFPETQKATMTSTLAPARTRQLCARS